jgi:hypothetical protein
MKMNGNFTRSRCGLCSASRGALYSLVILILAAVPAHGGDSVAIDVVRAGQSTPVTLLFPGFDYELRVMLANSQTLGGFSLGFRVWSPDGASWQWLDVGGYGPEGLDSGKACVTVAPGSRLDSPDSVFQMGYLYVSEQNVDEAGADSIMVGAVSWGGIAPGLAAGPLQHMMSLHFVVQPGNPDSIYTLCFDSCFVPPYGDFVFVDWVDAHAIDPEVVWPPGGLCLPVRYDTCGQPGDANSDGVIDSADWQFLAHDLCGGLVPEPLSNGDADGNCVINGADIRYIKNIVDSGYQPKECTCANPELVICKPGDANWDGDVNTADAVYLINFVFKGGPAPIPCPITSGDANCDCRADVGDAVYIINYVFKGGPAPCTCEEWLDRCGPPIRK